MNVRKQIVSPRWLLALAVSASVALSGANLSAFSNPKAPAKKPAAAVTAPAAETSASYQTVSPVDLLKDPSGFLDKNVSFEGVFNNFSSLGLDYKKAMRDSKDYVSFLIRRPDVTHHTIPMSELKLIFPRKKSEDVMHLETGDKILVKGKVFSTALNEPWLDVAEIKVLQKLKPLKEGEKPKNNLAE